MILGKTPNLRFTATSICLGDRRWRVALSYTTPFCYGSARPALSHRPPHPRRRVGGRARFRL